MHILDLDKCQLLERLKKDHDRSKIHDVDFDTEFWDNVVNRLVRLLTFPRMTVTGCSPISDFGVFCSLQTLISNGIDAFTVNMDALQEFAKLHAEKDKQNFLRQIVEEHVQSTLAKEQA